VRLFEPKNKKNLSEAPFDHNLCQFLQGMGRKPTQAFASILSPRGGQPILSKKTGLNPNQPSPAKNPTEIRPNPAKKESTCA
jgi:hypothetical protein